MRTPPLEKSNFLNLHKLPKFCLGPPLPFNNLWTPPPPWKNVLDPQMQWSYKNGMKFQDVVLNCFKRNAAWKKRLTSHSVHLSLSEKALWKIDSCMKKKTRRKTRNKNYLKSFIDSIFKMLIIYFTLFQRQENNFRYKLCFTINVLVLSSISFP